MINNDVLRSIRYMLDLSEPKVVDFTLTDEQNFPPVGDTSEMSRSWALVCEIFCGRKVNPVTWPVAMRCWRIFSTE